MASNADIYTAARKGLVEYRTIFLPAPNDVKSPAFHYDWSRELLNGEGHAAFEGFRESGKGSIILRAFPLYALTFPNDKWRYIVILKANMAQARKALRNITNEYMNNPFINARLVKVLKNTADVFEVELDGGNGKNITILIEAYGKGASIRGLNNKDVRPSLILIDDCQDSADLLSEVVPEQDWDWFLSDVMFLATSARVFMIGNNLGEKCIIERVAKNADRMGFKFKRIACANPELTESTWAEKQTIEEILKERADYEAIGKIDVWLREKMCMAVSDETRLFKDEMYREYPASLKDSIAREGEVLAALDPASSTRKDACFRAIVVGALMPDGHWYILDVPYGRWDSVEMMNKMFEVVRKWGIRDFGIEKGQYQQVIEPVLYREMTLKRCRFNVTPLEHGKIGSKLERIKMLQPYFKSGSIWFPSGADWLTEIKNELAGVTRDELKSEYVDLIDSLAMLVTQMRVFSARATERRERYNMKREAEYEFNPMTA
jgi:predicted phage terminase large subunit-like protein